MLAILVRDVLAEVTSKSETDTLSGLLNRGGFERQAELAVLGAVRQGVPVALVIADLDHFKSINDSFGHASGDRVIETFAGFLREAAAGHHVAGRIGGEEFAIILPGTNLPPPGCSPKARAALSARCPSTGCRRTIAARRASASPNFIPAKGLPI